MEISPLDKVQRINLLLDYYDVLLTSKQQLYLDYYYRQDYSLAEIAKIQGVTRTAVFDTLKKAVLRLENYEDKLQLIARAHQRIAIIQAIESKQENESILALLQRLKEI